MEIKLEDVKKFLEENKDSEDVKSFVQGLNPITLDSVKTFVQKDKDGKSWLDSERDKHTTKAIETWKTNNLDKIVDEKVKELYPDEDPKDKKLKELQAEMEKIKKDAAIKELTNKAYVLADEKGLPKDLIPYLLGEDETATQANIDKVTEVFTTHVTDLVDKKFKGGYRPPQGSDGKGGSSGIGEKLAKAAADSQKNVSDAQNSYFE